MRYWIGPLAALFAVVLLAVSRSDPAENGPSPGVRATRMPPQPVRLLGSPARAAAPAASKSRGPCEAPTDARGLAAPKPAHATARFQRARAALTHYVARVVKTPDVADLRAAQARVRAALASLEPIEVVRLIGKTKAPAALEEVTRRLDRGLEADRGTWEDALFLGLEEADRDPSSLAHLAEVAEPRLELAPVRRAAAAFLAKRDTTDRIASVQARLSEDG